MNLRRRTRCVYCGKRIPGALTRRDRDSWQLRQVLAEHTFAARFACAEHRDVLIADPEYAYWIERAA